MNTKSPIFVSVATSAYSGATLLAFLLGNHPQIATIGEMNGLITGEDPDKYLCSCGIRIKECEFWKSVQLAMHDRGFEFETSHFDTKLILSKSPFIQRLFLGSSRNATLDSIRDGIIQSWPEGVRKIKAWSERNVAFIDAVLEVMEKLVFVDTSKNPSRPSLLHKYSSLDARAIHLVRDVRGVALSTMRHRVGMGAQKAALQWKKLNLRLDTSLNNLPDDKRIQLRYEDLCRDVQGTLNILHRFCEVDANLSTKDFGTMPHHIIGNAMRLKSIRKVELDERWKSQLSDKQLDEIEDVAGRLNRSYGYG